MVFLLIPAFVLLLLLVSVTSGPAHAQPVTEAHPETSPYPFNGPVAQSAGPLFFEGAYMHQGALGNDLSPTPAAATYDEQIGETFMNLSLSMAYNVTATVQTDANGYGPAYLLNGPPSATGTRSG